MGQGTGERRTRQLSGRISQTRLNFPKHRHGDTFRWPLLQFVSIAERIGIVSDKAASVLQVRRESENIHASVGHPGNHNLGHLPLWP